MKFRTHKKHFIDYLFPIALFFVLAASSFAVLLLAANLYSSTTDRIQANDEQRTCLSYISGKVRQNDTNGDISIVSVDGTDCLALASDYNGTHCTTYIYVLDGTLKELFIKDGIDISLDGGKDILETASLEMEERSDGVFRFFSKDKNGTEDSLILSERSTQ